VRLDAETPPRYLRVVSPGAFVFVVGHGPTLESEDGAATLLRQLGACVVTSDYWADFATELSEDAHEQALAEGARCRAVVVEAHDRPDFATAALRSVKKEDRFRDVPAIVALPQRQVARVEPSSGFDDFIVVPYVATELYARIRQLEWKNSEFATDERLKMGALVIDRAAHEVTVDGRRIVLTAKEFALLAFLAANRGRVLGREVLLTRVWGMRYEGGARTVDIHVRRLRAKLGDALPLETLRGAGYKLRAPSRGDDSGASDDTPLPSLATVKPSARASNLLSTRRHAR
jgi:DNA-binding response OmpR family regulator